MQAVLLAALALFEVLLRCAADGAPPPARWCDVAAEDAAPGASEGTLNLSLHHPLFATSRGVVPGVVYSVTVAGAASDAAFSLASTRGVFLAAPSLRTCPGRRWVVLGVLSPGTQRTLNWTLRLEDGFANVSFRLQYGESSLAGEGSSYLQHLAVPVLRECDLALWPPRGNVSWRDLPPGLGDCRLAFPASKSARRGVVVELNRLNVPCQLGGYLQLGAEPGRQRRFCGKLEELPGPSRSLYFPSSASRNAAVLVVAGRALFALGYRLVDHCHNVTMTARNDSVAVSAGPGMECTFRVHLPYGNRVSLRLRVNPGPVQAGQQSDDALQQQQRRCEGLLTSLWDGAATRDQCSRATDGPRDLRALSKGNTASLRVSGGAGHEIKLSYHAQPVTELVQRCPYGWVAARQHCLTAVEDVRLPWTEAEDECRRRGGHLATVRSEEVQLVVDSMLLNSPAYGEHNSYWIGATDSAYEGDFRWANGLPFSYTNWFPGWQHDNWYNRQPNDDPYGDQDCVEVRQVFHTQSAGARLAPGFSWNDRDCATANYFLCDRLMPGVQEEDSWQLECNRTVVLSKEQPRATVVSPEFPRLYPDNAECDTDIVAPTGYQLVLEFDELVLEDEETCSYDYLELLEADGGNSSSEASRYCGDWSSKLKLLRYVSTSPRLKLHFVSDYSHHYSGFKARVSMQTVAMECADGRLQVYNNHCYLFASYPEVTWHTAHQICAGMKADLASIHSGPEEDFVTSNLRSSLDYSAGSLYWLGGTTRESGGWAWSDNTDMSFTAWLGEDGHRPEAVSSRGDACLAMQWVSSQSTAHSSGLYWQPRSCALLGGYVCKKGSQVAGSSSSSPGSSVLMNRTVDGSEGFLSSPSFPEQYFNNMDYWVRIRGPERSRLVIRFSSLDMEEQPECLYDFVELSSGGLGEPVRWCGTHYEDIDSFRLVSSGRELDVHFHSDYSVSGSGFAASWHAVDVSGCPSQTLTAAEGSLFSPNYPHFLIPGLDCATTILAPVGKRVWLEFTDYDLEAGEALLEVDLGSGERSFKPYQIPGHLTDGAYVSHSEKLQIHLRTGDHPRGRGFKAAYRTVSRSQLERIVNLTNVSSGTVRHLNYPSWAPPDTDFVQHLLVPLGNVILLELYGMAPSEQAVCAGGSGLVEVVDNYADANGTGWLLCEDRQRATGTAPVTIASYLNTLHVRQRSWAAGLRLNGTLKVRPDSSYKLKLLRGSEEGSVESCHPSPCQNGGKCVGRGPRSYCQCTSHFTGMFCALTMCELEPCLFGRCQLTATSFSCSCQPGYSGKTCEEKQQPCADNPCEGRGECMHKGGDSFYCRCHAWWEGPRCERRMLHIPFKPLSERMLQEPFWLGLITVTVVLAVIGLVWCAKRHFPEKLEKLLAEEADRHRPSVVSCHSRPPSVREQLSGAGATVVVVPSPTPGCPRSLLGRLGIRKPSLLSLTSPHGGQPAATATSRTFSLDDLLKPPPRRTPSPRKKRNNSTPTSKNISEKKQILQHLITPPSREQPSRKVSLGELIQLSERKLQDKSGLARDEGETAFTEVAADPKLEKKVTFARLLSKVSAEMSSGSEASQMLSRSNSTPPSPAAEQRSPHSTSSNQGSDSMSSLDANNLARRPTRLLQGCRPLKNHSADSILAMFRNFSSTTPHRPSPCSTPTASSPHDDSSASSAPTPVSSSSLALDSPPVPHRHTIEVPVLDALDAVERANLLHPPTILLEIPSSGSSKCLSPIHEVPTPLATPSPSPALTPVMGRGIHMGHRSPGGVATSEEDDDFSISLQPAGTKHDTPQRDDVARYGTTMCSIPMLVVQEPSPTRSLPPGSPPPKSPTAETSFVFATKPARRLLKDMDKTNSLELPCPPPVITVTCNMSEVESDAEVASPGKKLADHQGGPSTGVTMTYLSPFSMCSRADRTASESNLSSSGYSSMASPGPSRCGSNNPLCPSEVEDPPGPNIPPENARRKQFQSQAKQTTILCPEPKTTSLSENTASENESHKETGGGSQDCVDSETQSDDPFVESNDEGIGTDHLDEKIEEGELKSAKELQLFIGKEFLENGGEAMSIAVPAPGPPKTPTTCWVGEGASEPHNLPSLNTSASKSSLQLPSIVIQNDACPSGEKYLSPVSSRSESPLSDKLAGPGRFSPLFYGRHKDQLPFTDSDGLYDCPSSDCPKAGVGSAPVQQHRKSTGRRRDKRTTAASRGLAVAAVLDGGPTTGASLLDVPGKEQHCRPTVPRKHSPKRTRLRTHSRVSSSSSSSESIVSSRDTAACRADHEDSHLPSERGVKTPQGRLSAEASGEDNSEDASSAVLPEAMFRGEIAKPQRRISKLRAIGHQIRFLRRLEQGLRRREALASPSDSVDSCEDDEEDGEGLSMPLSPLLPKTGGSAAFRSRLRRDPSRQRSTHGWQMLPQEDIYGQPGSLEGV